MRIVLAIILFTLALHSETRASKVVCNSLYSNARKSLSNSAFIPLGVFLESEKNVHAVRSFLEKRTTRSVGPGIGIMYQTANIAAKKVMNSLKIAPEDLYVFDKPSGNIHQDFIKTMTILVSRQYKYVQNALVLDTQTGVYTVLPLAQYDPKADTYIPIVIKGHQDLKKSDSMAAAITSYAIGRWLGKTPEVAKVILRPIVAKRKSTNINEAEHTIVVENERVKIDEIYEQFIKEEQKYYEIYEQKRYEYSKKSKNPNKEEFLKEVIAPLLSPEKQEITQIPYAPSKQQRKVLSSFGYPTKKELANLDINSVEFLKVSIASGIAPYRLKYLINRARAYALNDVLILENYNDPGEGLDYVLHFDIEGAFEPEIKSGSYYLGVEFQSQKTIGAKVKEYSVGDKNPDKYFIGGFREFNQVNVDKAWADFLRLLKNDQRLKNGKYKIAVYSSYEEVKINQLVDIRKDKPANFTEKEKSSTINIKGREYPLYKEIEVYAPKPGQLGRKPHYQTVGYLIRRHDFFRDHSDLTPNDIFNYKEKLFDMLPFYRHHVAGPAKNNSLKSLLLPVQKELPASHKRYSYGNGDNGLNCIAWYYHYIRTGDPTYLERIRTYLELDIDGNRMLWDFIRRHANESVDSNLVWSEQSIETITQALPLFKRIATIRSLSKKQDALEKVFGMKISQLSDQDFMSLSEILDRGAYLGDRKALISNKKFGKKRIKAILSHQKNSFETQRKKLFLEFAKSLNPDVNTPSMSPETQDALYYLFSLPSGQVTQNTLNKMLIKSQIQPEVEKFIRVNKLKRRFPNMEPEQILELLNDHEVTHISKKLKKANYKLLKFNLLDSQERAQSIKEYGFDKEFESYESVNLKEIWEGVFIKMMYLKN